MWHVCLNPAYFLSAGTRCAPASCRKTRAPCPYFSTSNAEYRQILLQQQITPRNRTHRFRAGVCSRRRVSGEIPGVKPLIPLSSVPWASLVYGNSSHHSVRQTSEAPKLCSTEHTIVGMSDMSYDSTFGQSHSIFIPFITSLTACVYEWLPRPF
ncbi:uncharacterized protein BCR38DRAFT_87824 [Pseudomassariella vexata]|uniref:Uncharacterized protein n=1 Tax=Pseudomassariella vexata TaxID=1141098 RepID=A0A1Y2ED96_9PEZI|nr:uncharacterized protein BCR38DRAFT_87824 [Pseudomassariella vexata]ORY69549.1 hypothetical protein BCR38DRAFT_87824 [Pseudomassariella vexata]